MPKKERREKRTVCGGGKYSIDVTLSPMAIFIYLFTFLGAIAWCHGKRLGLSSVKMQVEIWRAATSHKKARG